MYFTRCIEGKRPSGYGPNSPPPTQSSILKARQVVSLTFNFVYLNSPVHTEISEKNIASSNNFNNVL